MLIYLPLVVCLVGLGLWFYFSKSRNPDTWWADFGKVCFWTGLGVWLVGVSLYGKPLFGLVLKGLPL